MLLNKQYKDAAFLLIARHLGRNFNSLESSQEFDKKFDQNSTRQAIQGNYKKINEFNRFKRFKRPAIHNRPKIDHKQSYFSHFFAKTSAFLHVSNSLTVIKINLTRCYKMPNIKNTPNGTNNRTHYDYKDRSSALPKQESVLASVFHAFALPAAICAIGVTFFWSLPANSQTLNCINAKTTAEFTVCNSEKLMLLDERVDEIFTIAFADQPTKPQQQAISRQHNNWRIKRASCGGDNTCLSKLYTSHIESLAASATSQSNITAFSSNN